jgi:hypothetical protein
MSDHCHTLNIYGISIAVLSYHELSDSIKLSHAPQTWEHYYRVLAGDPGDFGVLTNPNQDALAHPENKSDRHQESGDYHSSSVQEHTTSLIFS